MLTTIDLPPGLHADTGGVKRFALLVTPNGHKTFVVSYRGKGGKSHRHKIGPADRMTIKAARKKAEAINGRLANGEDPAGELAEARKAPTVKALCERYSAKHLPKRDSSQREYKALLEVIDNKLGSKKVADVRFADIDALRWSMKDSPYRANRAVGLLTRLFGFAVSWEMATRNPCTKIERFDEHSRDRVLTDDELAAIWRATEGAGAFNNIVRLLILTAQRRAEVGCMAWKELSADLSTWTIPKDRAKNNKQHIVPLPGPVRELLRSLPRSHELVFPGQRGEFSGWSKSKAALDDKSDVAGWRLHDLRRTAATGLQKLGVRLEVTEQILNHISGSRAGIVGVYQRHEFANEKRAALEAWSEHVIAVVEGRAESSNVLSLSFQQAAVS